MTVALLITWISIILILTGTFFVAIAAIGVLRLPDLYTRMHAAAKAGAFGGSLILIATALLFGSWVIAIKVVLIILFFYASTPVAGHMIGRAGYLTGIRQWSRARVDELKGKYQSSSDSSSGKGSLDS
jgi:multicomponent Na+:H+ antiporter subunit G